MKARPARAVLLRPPYLAAEVGQTSLGVPAPVQNRDEQLVRAHRAKLASILGNNVQKASSSNDSISRRDMAPLLRVITAVFCDST